MRKVLRSGTWLVSLGVILVFLAACMDSEAKCPEEVYVAPSGSDSAAGTRDAPLRTVQVGVSRLGSRGGAVKLAGGTYARQRVVLRDRDHVTVRAVTGAEPVLDATGLTGSRRGPGRIAPESGEDPGCGPGPLVEQG